MKRENPVMRVGAVFVALILVAVAVMFVVRVARIAYGYGYEMFAQTPVSEEPGRVVIVTVKAGDSVKDIGKLLEDRGLIREDPYDLLFRLQERFSDYHGKLSPGTYELNTAMTPDQMMEIMSAAAMSAPAELIEEGNSQLGGEGAVGDTDDGEEEEE